jgi:hypothetical protein
LTIFFTAETFRPRIAEPFRVALENGRTLELRLEEVRAAGEETAGPDRDAGLRLPFSILFRGPLDPLLPQKTYLFEHDELGSFDLFIVPIGRDEAGTCYEAVFG